METWSDKKQRWLFNFFPAFRSTGARIIYLSQAEQHIRVRLPLKLRTRNYVGTIYGGVMYGALDGILMVLFIRLLGKDYIVWDKAGRIDYLRPGRETLYADISVTDADLALVRNELLEKRSFEKEYTLEWKTRDGEVICRVHKLLYFRKNA